MPTVLIVDDSSTAREVLVGIFSTAPDLEVVGCAKDGREAVTLAKQLRPDVITMDMNMPVMDGFEATAEIMIESPTRILIVTASPRASEVETAMKALRAGALTVQMKPVGPHSPNFQSIAKELVNAVRAMADVVVVGRRRSKQDTQEAMPTLRLKKKIAPIRAIAIVASTGGPPALASLLGGLPKSFPVPILVVQHIVPGFISGFASWLDSVVELNVKVAQDHEQLSPGRIYIAPHESHLGITRACRIRLSDEPEIGGFRPAGTYLFDSVATALGPEAAGVIMTGMGRDGVDGLVKLHNAGGQTIAQDQASSVVFGMPNVAIEQGAVDIILPLTSIASFLVELVAAPIRQS